MNAQSDQAKGKAKQAAGVITGDKNLEAEGKNDRVAADVKGKVEQAKEKVEEVIDLAEEKANDLVDKAKDALHRK